MAQFLILFREGLEAALIVGIVLGYLTRTGRMSQHRMAWLGVGAAVFLSAALAMLIRFLGGELVGTAEQLFEGITMLIAAIIVTGMVFWMQRHARLLKSDLESSLGAALVGGTGVSVAVITFTAVIREGIETALLLSAISFTTDSATALLGSVLGLLAATGVGFLIYTSAVRLNLRMFFNVTSVLLLVFAAGLLARSVHEFQEAGVLFTLSEHVWNTSMILDEASVVGQFAEVLFGYMSQPSLESVLIYVVYIVSVAMGLRGAGTRHSSQKHSVSSA